jgi:hypothetical protein
MKKNDETFIQIYLFSFLRKLEALEPVFLAFSIPNGGSRNKAEASNLKMAGATAGIPDICVLHDGGVFFVELKKKTNGKISKEQHSIISKINTLGHDVHIIYADTPKEAIEAIAPLMNAIGCSYQGISKSSSSALAALGSGCAG